jgi:hypothetical protein
MFYYLQKNQKIKFIIIRNINFYFYILVIKQEFMKKQQDFMQKQHKFWVCIYDFIYDSIYN